MSFAPLINMEKPLSRTHGKCSLTHSIPSSCYSCGAECSCCGGKNHWQCMCHSKTPTRSPLRRGDNHWSRNLCPWYRCRPRSWHRGGRYNGENGTISTTLLQNTKERQSSITTTQQQHSKDVAEIFIWQKFLKSLQQKSTSNSPKSPKQLTVYVDTDKNGCTKVIPNLRIHLTSKLYRDVEEIKVDGRTESCVLSLWVYCYMFSKNLNNSLPKTNTLQSVHFKAHKFIPAHFFIVDTSKSQYLMQSVQNKVCWKYYVVTEYTNVTICMIGRAPSILSKLPQPENPNTLPSKPLLCPLSNTNFKTIIQL